VFPGGGSTLERERSSLGGATAAEGLERGAMDFDLLEQR